MGAVFDRGLDDLAENAAPVSKTVFLLPSPSSAPFHLRQAQLSRLGIHYTRCLPLPFTPDTYSIYLVLLTGRCGWFLGGVVGFSKHQKGLKI
ncbi:hypothetical protein QBC32DRAFT_338813 [Pseudoneurospora amorphoporcata]|uniref:Uncharacterized protein n=1 Tax=Pseudoneurospora amorphoporcata TaxID=241081 RepID=A0AAN6P0Q7_9PEZI|nr:hypothetical protein QBC32DRAFT_338813 [Pseudoneurospora amorphoporcata]